MTRDKATIDAAYKEMNSLQNAAMLADRNYELYRAADLYEKARLIAESLQEQRYALYYRASNASAINRTGKLKQALSILSPILQVSPKPESADTFCGAIYQYINTAINLPVKLQTIQKAASQAEDFLKTAGQPAWQAMRLRTKSNLLLQQGQYTEALKAAQESWACYQEGYPQTIPAGHLHQMIVCSLALGDVEAVHRYLHQYEHFEAEKQRNDMPQYKLIRFTCRNSEYSRLQGDYRSAENWARKAVVASDSIDNEEDLQDTRTIAVRAFLAVGECDRAQEYLLKLFPRRHAEEGYLRYSLRLLWGDYHLAVARKAAGIAPMDDQYGTMPRGIEPVENLEETTKALKRAAQFYGYALKIGVWIDTQLACDWRSHEVQDRLKRVHQIKTACT